MFDSLSAAELKTGVDLRRIVRYFWGEPVRERARYAVYASRWRDDGRRPAFTVYDTYFKDYGGDGIGGDVYDFLMLEMATDFKRAVEWLEDYTGGTVSIMSQRQPVKTAYTAHDEPPPLNWQAAAATALDKTQQILWQTPAALDYLHNMRGLDDETIHRAGYGYNPDWLAVNWINPDTGRAAYLPPGIIEPWVSDGVLWALRVRCRVGDLAKALDIQADTMRDGREIPKYLNLAGSKQSGALYNADTITTGCDLLIVEGGFDARLAEQILGTQAAVVTFGSATNRPNTRRLKQIQQAQRVYLLLDADAAGQDAQSRLAATLGEKARLITLPAGKDVTDFVRDGGDLHALLNTATAPGWWSHGLPDTVRSTLLNYFRPTAAPVIEMVNTAVNRGLLEPDGFTLDQLLTANIALEFNISESSLRRVVSELEGHFFSRLETNTPSGRDMACHVQQQNISRKTGRAPLRYKLLPLDTVKQTIIAWAVPRIYEKHHPADPVAGQGIVARPTPAMMEALGFDTDNAAKLADRLDSALNRVYNLQDDAQIRAGSGAFRALARLTRDLENPDNTPLPENWPLANGTQYRAAFLRATNDPDARRSRSQIQKLLGVANGSVDKMVQQAGLKKAAPEGDYEVAPVTTPRNIKGQVRTAAKKIRGYPLTIISRRADGNTAERSYRGADSTSFIAESLANGGEVFVKFQVANRYLETTDKPPQAQARPQHRSIPAYHGDYDITVKSRRRTYYGPVYDPGWLRDQFALALRRTARIDYQPVPFIVDQLTGELLNPDGDPPDPHRLLRLLLPEVMNDPVKSPPEPVTA